MTILENIKQLVRHLTNIEQLEQVEAMLIVKRQELEEELYAKK
tara:strand:+ start:93 stop:221 length:129 start_codon:yes stop_codon:yes gene_type:complete